MFSSSLLKIFGNDTFGNLSKLFNLGICGLKCLTLDDWRGWNITLNELHKLVENLDSENPFRYG